MRKIYQVDLSISEQERLSKLIISRKGTVKIVKRCYILLAADRNGTQKWKDVDIASAYKVSQRSVERLRCSYVEDGLEIALYGKPRSYKKEYTFDALAESQLIALRCSEPNKMVPGRVGWTLRLLANQMVELGYVESMSHETVRKILKKTKLSLGGSKNG